MAVKGFKVRAGKERTTDGSTVRAKATPKRDGS